ncbi:F0F1 ATP synthase subunit delta [Effusibacillus dendaii]|uniref:ATP synthase subunit delta n=1 Tax=Effusibacillus dendaii TaxID=2743772 RepID=A0A7I8DEK7_9BACL|nr:F0F1 ATP synthase subunit delta [Effusibacillus dendaii]BCJ87722.1 F0F1 ATP synthase subunit delta [Effusibacillus dendaii]
MIDGAVAKRYADALYSIAKEQNKLDEIKSELSLIVNALEEHPQLKRILQHPAISVEVKKKQTKEVFGQVVSGVVSNFLSLLLDRHRENQLAGIYKEYSRLVDEASGRIKAHIETAAQITETELEELNNRLTTQFGKKIDLTASVNSSLIAGARLTIGDRVIDASVQGKLAHFSETLKRNQVR